MTTGSNLDVASQLSALEHPNYRIKHLVNQSAAILAKLEVGESYGGTSASVWGAGMYLGCSAINSGGCTQHFLLYAYNCGAILATSSCIFKVMTFQIVEFQNGKEGTECTSDTSDQHASA